MSQLLELAIRQRPALIQCICSLAEVESPSDNPAAVNACAELAATYAERLGARVRLHRQLAFGHLLELRWGRTSAARRPILLLGHLDTVWPLGTLASMPIRQEKGRLWGPGVLDMKAGVAMAFSAIQILRASGLLRRPLTMLLVSEEEIGSPCSRAVTEKIARECEAVYVLEPAQGLAGAYKTARKGVGHYTLRVKGIPAHAGVDFEAGHSAVLELARQLERISTLTDPARGLTVNAGVIGGGTRSNVIAEDAWAEGDVRIARPADTAHIERKLRRLRPVDKACRLTLEGGIDRPPMERTPGTVALYKRARELASGLGFTLEEAATGGGSDGNFTSALGVPTLDGMGAVGEGAHARNESLLVEQLAPRTALLAALLAA